VDDNEVFTVVAIIDTVKLIMLELVTKYNLIVETNFY